jgi:hypothetical protein
MSKAPRRKDENDTENGHAPVPPYPAEVAATWQAFRVTMRDDKATRGEAAAPADAPPKRAPEDSDSN